MMKYVLSSRISSFHPAQFFCVITLGMLSLGANSYAATGAETYQQVCSACHTGGLNNAPKLGDKKQWVKLIKEGQAHISADGYYGVRAMPARGGDPNLSVAEFAAAVVYMANQAGANWQNPDEAMLKTINARLAKKQAQAAAKKT
ncbi:MAG: c-type cytochrome [Burkholderiaceae bacterium]